MSHQSLTKVSKHPTWSTSTQNDKMHWLNSLNLNIPSLSSENGLNCSSFALCLRYRLLCTEYWGENEGRSILPCDEWYHTVKVEIFSSHQHQCKGWFISIRPMTCYSCAVHLVAKALQGYSVIVKLRCLSSLAWRANLCLRRGTHTGKEWTVAKKGSMVPSQTDILESGPSYVWLMWQSCHLNSVY